ncbi:hypothetical protein BGX29_007737 [Mortierella sp. GBA35]|nr:hypothetical protein BGX29_007737 [Mortierella sp. GBA35]
MRPCCSYLARCCTPFLRRVVQIFQQRQWVIGCLHGPVGFADLVRNCHYTQVLENDQLGIAESFTLRGKLAVGLADIEHYAFTDCGIEAPSVNDSFADMEDALDKCLEFSFESGLELLVGLKELQHLDVRRTAHQIRVAEMDWMRIQRIEGLLTERRWAGEGEDGARVKKEVQA